MLYRAHTLPHPSQNTAGETRAFEVKQMNLLLQRPASTLPSYISLCCAQDCSKILLLYAKYSLRIL